MTVEQWKREFSKRVHGKLEELGMTQRELADKSGLGESTLSRYLNCQRVPRADVIVCIARVLHCGVGELIEVGEMVH